MKELHQTAFAYYRNINEDLRRWIEEVFSEMDSHGNDQVTYQDFVTYMEKHEDCKHLSTRRFFDELKEEGRECLSFPDVVTLVYIVYTERPFCKGKCFDDDSTAATFDVCPDCCYDEKYDHCHKSFLDNVLLLQMKRRVGANSNNKGQGSSATSKPKAPASSSGNSPARTSNFSCSCSSASSSLSSSSSTSSYSTTSATSRTNSIPSNSTAPLPIASSSPTTSNAVVPVNPKPKSSAAKKALKTVEVLLALGNIFAATQCTIM